MPEDNNTGNRGFASMDPERQREIASEGGRAAHESGNAHEFTSEEAREAGRKGGQARSGGDQGDEGEQGGQRGGAGNFANDRERASQAGREGGKR
jgi:general stress protein YciG